MMSSHKQAETSFQLSRSQARIWYLQQLHPDIPLFNVAGHAVISGEIDSFRWLKAVNQLLAKHQMLRARFQVVENEPNQYISEIRNRSFKVIDFSKEEFPELQLNTWIQAQAETPFLTEDYLFDTALIKLGNARFAWFVKVHHLIADGWALSLIFKKVGEYYAADEQNALEDGDSNFVEFLGREKDYLKGDQMQRDLENWISNLSQFDGKVWGEQKFRIRATDAYRQLLVIDAVDYSEMNQWSAAQGGSFLHYFLTAFSWYSHSFENKEFATVGLPVLNRSKKVDKQTIGLFMNVLPLVLELGDGDSLVDIFQSVRRQSKNLLKHQQCPIKNIQEELAVNGPLFNTLISYEKHNYGQHFGDFDAEVTFAHNSHEEHDLTVHIMEYAEGAPLVIAFDFNREAFPEEQGELMVQRMQHLLNELPTQGSMVLKDTQPLSMMEATSVHTKFPNGPKSETEAVSVPNAWNSVRRSFADEIAVRNADAALSYAEVETLSNQFASAIVQDGCATPVGVMMQRNIHLPVLLLALAKTGRAWVPLSTTFPIERVENIIEQTGIETIVTDELGAHKLSESLVNIYTLAALLTTDSDNDEYHAATDSDAPLYITFTSGSTGQPKGVVVSHYNVVSFAQNLLSKFKFQVGDSILSVTNLTFDISLLELLCSLLSGMQVVIPDEDQVNDPSRFLSIVQDLNVDVLQLTPSRLKALTEFNGYDFLRNIKTVLIGGEELKKNEFEKLKPLLSETAFFNVYGPSETTIWSSAKLLKADEPNSLGTPLSGEQVYILDSSGKPAPILVAGEVCIAGEGVSKGYLGLQEMTNEKFVEPHEVLQEASRGWKGLLYKTGDVARWSIDGTIDFLGRNDRQVKKRGYRIELGEIEFEISRIQGVQNNVVIPLTNAADDVELVAYVVLNGSTTMEPFCSSLANMLPDYYYPDYFVQLDAFPLNNSGKIDTSALPAPDRSVNTRIIEEEREPTAIEARLMPWFCRALELEMIGLQDDFFSLGGHSLKATRLLSNLAEHEHISLSLRNIFEHASVEKLARYIDSSVQDETCKLTKAVNQDSFPLSRQQERMWVLNQLEPESSAYNMFGVYRISGQINEAAYYAAFAQMVERHKSLLTRFKTLDGELVQYFDTFQNDQQFVTTQSVGQDDAELEQTLVALVHKPFDLLADQLFRVHLIHNSADETVAVFVFHHIICDGWSTSIFARDFFEAYTALIQGEETSFKPLQFNYGDYATWSRSDEYLGQHKSSQNYWQEKLHELNNDASFPLDKPRSNALSADGETIRISIPAPLSKKLTRLCSELGITPFVALLSITKLLLYKYTGQRNSPVGIPVSGRQEEGVQQIIGHFVNTLVSASSIDASLSFKAVLEAEAAGLRADLDHQQYPFEQLVDVLDVKRETGRNPLFDVFMSLTEEDFDPATYLPEGTGLEVSSLGDQEFLKRYSKFDLSFDFVKESDQLALDLEYRSALFTDDTINNIGKHWLRVLEQVLDNSVQTVSSLSLLSPEEENQLVLEWGRGPKWEHSTLNIAEAILQRGDTNANDVALVDGETKLTYQELKTESLRWCSQLRELNLKEGTPVGVLSSRSVHILPAILGVLFSKLVYLPLETSLPEERLNYMIEDANCQVVVCVDADLPNLSLSSQVELVKRQDIKSSHKEIEAQQVRSHDPAYIIYTSGSTGLPKGVLVEHASFADYIQTFTRYFDLSENDAVLQQASLSFDTSLEEIFPILLAGGRLVMATERQDPNYLLNLVRDNEITIVSTSPLMLNFFNETSELPASLRIAISGGDVLKFSYVDRLAKTVDVYNTYGPTETTVCATYQKVDASQNGDAVSIGKPIANTQLLVLDADGRPTGVGIVGELHIGGTGVAKCYLGLPELSEEKFVELEIGALNEKAIQRFYRSGDQVKWRKDGTIDFIGRADTQVSIRGFRIELGEIEHVLLSHPHTKDVVVDVWEGGVGPELVAWIVGGSAIDLGEVKQFLRNRLPAYSVPSRLFSLSEFPQNANGKLDKKTLLLGLSEQQGLAPSDEVEGVVEAKLLGVWNSIVGHDKIGRSASFFEVGGQSIIAIRLAGAIQEEFEVAFTLKDVFQFDTIAAQAKFIEAQVSAPISRIPSVNSGTGRYPASKAQERMLALCELNEESMYNMTGGIQWEGPLNKDSFVKAVQFLVDRYQILRTSFAMGQEGVEQQVADSFALPLTWHDSSVESATYTQKVIERVQHVRYDLQKGPLFQLHVIPQESIDKNVILFSIHHIISDGWSAGILFQQLFKAYQAIVNNEQLLLSADGIQYKDYTVWAKSSLPTVIEKSQSYWQEKLTDLEPTELTASNAASNEDTSGHTVKLSLGVDLTKTLQVLAQERKVSQFAVITALVNVLLYKYTGQTKIVLGTPVSGREHPDLHDQVGLFVNTLVLRQQMSSAQTFLDLLAEVQQEIVTSIEHAEYPYDLMVEGATSNLSAGQTPLFNCMLFMDENSEELFSQSVQGVQISELELMEPEAKFDITFGFQTTGSGLCLNLNYRKSKFDTDRMQRLLRHFEYLTKEVLNAPQSSIVGLNILSEEEQSNLIRKYNQTFKHETELETITGRFQTIVEEHKDRGAIQFEESLWSYEALDMKSNALTKLLLEEKKVQKGDVVAVVAGRTPVLIQSLLAVLKTGACYLPIDPALPESRIEFMLEDSRAKLVLTEDDFVHVLNNCAVDHILASTTAKLDGVSENPKIEIESSDIAYLIYTSGTTGKPKGTLVSHGAVCNLVQWHTRFYEVDMQSKATLFSGIGFDASAWEIWPYLLNGAQLFPLPETVRSSFGKLSVFYTQNSISHTFLPTAVIHTMLEDGFSYPTTLKILAGGEKLRSMPVPGMQLFNNYGPTENAVVATAIELGSWAGTAESIPIGQPIDGVGILLLNEDGELVPEGEVGELLLFGASLASGYLNRADATAEKFIDLPHRSAIAKALNIAETRFDKAYRTGDLVSWMPDGNLAFIGRSDQQVKIRGYRIELEEIESVTKQVVHIKDALVRILENENQPVLAAWIKGEEKKELVDQVHEQWQTLPNYMRPEYILFVDAFPLTPNGKIDFKALPQPDWLTTELKEVVPARHAEDEKLLGLLYEMLQVDKIGIDDNVFHHGMNSLKGMRFVSRIEQDWNIELGLAQLYVNSTVRLLHEKILSQGKITRVLVQKVATAENYPLSHAQKRVWITNELHPESEVAYRVHLEFEVQGNLDHQKLEQALHILSERHEVFRTIFQNDSGRLSQVVLDSPQCEFQHLETADSAVVRQEFKQQAFNLSTGPLLRLLVVRDEISQYVIIGLHHILADEQSMEILVKELGQTYCDLVDDLALSSTPHPWQYKDYASWHQQLLKSAEGDRLAEFWGMECATWPARYSMPTDFDVKAKELFLGKTVEFELDSSETASITALCQKLGISVFAYFVAITELFTARLIGRQAGSLGIATTDRARAEFEGMLGFFLNMCPVKFEIEEHLSLAEYLQKRHQHLISIYDHQLYPYDMILGKANKASRGTSDLFDMAVMLVEPPQIVEFGDVILKPCSDFNDSSKYDLTFMYTVPADRVCCYWEYNAEKFAALTIQDWIQSFRSFHNKLTLGGVEMPIENLIIEEPLTSVISDFEESDIDF
jgi:amino acid adenylation domain-containing protein